MNCERRVKALDHCGLHFQLLVPEQLYSVQPTGWGQFDYP